MGVIYYYRLIDSLYLHILAVQSIPAALGLSSLHRFVVKDQPVCNLGNRVWCKLFLLLWCMGIQ